MSTEPATEVDNYQKYRGKCKEMSEALVATDPTLRLVRGYYYCSSWGIQEHWWTQREDGTVVDPTKDQFPSKGMGIYEEFDGLLYCEVCNKEMREEEADFAGCYPICSYSCGRELVGI
jgi:hypothetical protein